MKSPDETSTLLGAPRLHFELKAMRIMTDRLYVDPGENDVLCGRGRQFYEHQGNIRFREIIERTLPYYAQSETKGEKTGFVRRVVSEISDKGGRFLKLDKLMNRWYEGDSVCAKSKVGHAFRDAIAEKQQQQQVQHESQSSSSDSDEGNESDKEPSETEVSKGATSLLMMLREPSKKTGLEGLEQNYSEKEDNSKTKLKSDQKEDSTVHQKRPEVPSTRVVNLQHSSINPKRSKQGASNQFGASLPDGFATVKHAMLNNLLLRQMALAKGINFQQNAETTAIDVDKSSRESSSSSRASASSLFAHPFLSVAKDHQPKISNASDTPVDLRGRKSVPDKPFDRLPSDQRVNRSASDTRSSAPDPQKPLAKKLETHTTAQDHPKDISRHQNSNSQNEDDKGRKPTAPGVVRQTLTPPPFGMMYRGTSRIPGMLDSAQLKRAMLKTLAQRQSALAKQQGQGSSRGQMQDIINLVNSARVPSSDVLDSTTAGRSSSAVTKPTMPSKAATVPKGSASPVLEALGHDTHGSERRRTPSPSFDHPISTHNAGSDSRSKMKRQRSTPSFRQHYVSSYNSKKPRALSELAHENTLLSQTEPCYPCSHGLFDDDDDDDGDDERDLYFL